MSLSTSRIFNPLTYSKRFAACTPMSDMHPEMPCTRGSRCHFWRRVSGFVQSMRRNDPCGYCTTTFATRPRSPRATRSRASFTVG